MFYYTACQKKKAPRAATDHKTKEKKYSSLEIDNNNVFPPLYFSEKTS